MKDNLLKSLLPLALLTCTALGFAGNAFAKEINLYNEPKADAKIVGQVDLSAGVIPIFTPKGGDWIKVGDPRNGNVGWIKSNDIQTGNGVTFTQRLISDGDGTQSYQKIEFGKPTPKPVTPVTTVPAKAKSDIKTAPVSTPEQKK